jgi:hypothetical protein
MRPETEKKLKKIKRLSNVLRTICKVLLAIVSCGFLAGMVGILAGRGTLAISDISILLNPLTVHARLVLAVVFALAMAVNFKVLYHLHRLFGNYGRGDIFTTESAGQIRQLGIAALLQAGANFLWASTAIALAQSHLPASFQFHADGLFIGPVIIAISWFMEMAAEMREENELTV